MSKSSPFLRNLPLSNEEAYELVLELEGREVEELNGVEIHSGLHPQHGSIHVVIPAIGDKAAALLPFELLPVVIQSF